MSLTSDKSRPAPSALPQPETARGTRRKVGVEVEFSGLDEKCVAKLLVQELGGEVLRDGEHRDRWRVEDSELGDFECYLDSRPLEKLDSDGIGKQVRDLARTVVPVEIVSGPILPKQISRLDDALDRLRDAGATGTRAGVLLGFGVHFNPEAVSLRYRDIAPVMTAYALMEPYLRRSADLDMSRRLLPWVDPWPRQLIDRLAATDAPPDMDSLMGTYLDLAPTRNHGLDMLCIFAQIDDARVRRAIEGEKLSPRPTFHWRMPDCRIDEPDWSLSLEWNRWVRVERVAQDTALLDGLRAAWRAHRGSLTSTRSDWAARVGQMLDEAGL